MADVRYSLPEEKLISLLYEYLVMGFVYGSLADEPMGPDDYDPLDKQDGQRRWVLETSKATRKKLRRYKQRSVNGSSAHE